MIEYLSVNAVGRARRETLDGKEYYVVNATTIVPGVLSGSKGPMLYQPDEVAQTVDAWNGMPIVLNHPFINGKPTSGRTPAVLEKYGLGTVYNSTFDGELKHEAWFDVEATKKKALQIYNALQAGDPIELSTGLYTNEVEAPKGSVWNGSSQYEYVARDMRPDHLAILTNERGACSNADGCGINVTRNSIWQKLGEMLGLNASTGQTRHPKKGTFEPHGTTSSQEDVHDAAQGGKNGRCADCDSPLDETGNCAKCTTHNAKVKCIECGGDLNAEGICEECDPTYNDEVQGTGMSGDPLHIGPTGNAWSDEAREAAAASRAAHAKTNAAKPGPEWEGHGTTIRSSSLIAKGGAETALQWSSGKHPDFPGETDPGKIAGYGKMNHESTAHEHSVVADRHREAAAKTSGASKAAHLEAAKAHDEAAKAHLKAAKSIPSTGVTKNAWSDEARQAAIDARDKAMKVTSKAADATEGSGTRGQALAHKNDAFSAGRMSTMAAEDNDPKEANRLSKEASDAHLKAAASHERLAQRTGDAKHKEAAALHQKAAVLHSSLIHNSEFNMDRRGVIQQLTTNCACWKGADRVLNAMTDEQLQRLLVTNVLDKPIIVGDKMLTFNATSMGFDMTSKPDKIGAAGATTVAGLIQDDENPEEAGETNVQVGPKKALVKNADAEPNDDDEPVVPRKKKVTANEWLQDAPPEIQQTFNYAKKIEAKERALVVNKLKNIAEETRNDKKREMILNKLKAKLPLGDLEELLVLVQEPTVNRRQEPLVRYDGGDEEFVVNAEADDDEPLGMPTINWNKEPANASR
jgi:hypothetical protein